MSEAVVFRNVDIIFGKKPERAVGILAHAWEQKQRGARIMGPMPREIPYRYSGPARRDVPPRGADAIDEHSRPPANKDRGG